MKKTLSNRLEREISRHEASLTKMADKRMLDLCREFESKVPYHTLSIQFGMGTELVEIDKEMLDMWDSPPRWRKRDMGCLTFIEDALRDVTEITFGYTRACPNDILSLTKQRRKDGITKNS